MTRVALACSREYGWRGRGGSGVVMGGSWSAGPARLLGLLICAARCSAWCLDGDQGACAFNVRSKSPDALPRAVVFFDASDAARGALQVSPARRELRVLLGGAAGGDTCLRLGEEGLLWLGSGEPPATALYQIEAVNAGEPSVLSLAGKRDRRGVCAAVRLADLEGAEGGASRPVTVFHNAERRVLGISFAAANALDSSEASVLLSTEAAAGSLRLDAQGTLLLAQSGAVASQHPRVELQRARGSAALPHIVLTDDVLGALEFSAFDGDKFGRVAALSAVVQGTVGRGRVAARLELATSGAAPGGALEPRVALDAAALELLSGTGLRVGGDAVVEGAGGLRVARGGLDVREGDLVVRAGRALLEAGDMELARGGLRAGADVEAKGRLVAGKDTELRGALAVRGAAQLDGALSVRGRVALEGGLSVSSSGGSGGSAPAALQVQGGLRVTGDVATTGRLEAAGALHSASLLVAGETELRGRVQLKGALAADADASIGGALHVAGAAVLKGSVAVGGAARLEAGADVAGRLAVAGDASVGGELAVKHALNVAGGLSVGKALAVAGGSTLQGDAIVRGALAVDKDANVAGELTVAHALKVAGDVAADKALAVAGDTTLQGAARVQGALIVDMDARIAGTLSAAGGALRVAADGGLALAAGLTVSGSAAIRGVLDVSGARARLAGGADVLAAAGDALPALRLFGSQGLELLAGSDAPRFAALSAAGGLDLPGVARLAKSGADFSVDCAFQGAVSLAAGSKLSLGHGVALRALPGASAGVLELAGALRLSGAAPEVTLAAPEASDLVVRAAGGSLSLAGGRAASLVAADGPAALRAGAGAELTLSSEAGLALRVGGKSEPVLLATSARVQVSGGAALAVGSLAAAAEVAPPVAASLFAAGPRRRVALLGADGDLAAAHSAQLSVGPDGALRVARLRAETSLSSAAAEVSDARLSRDVTPLGSAASLARVLALRGVSFRDAGGDALQLGLLAQEVEPVAPELVLSGEDGAVKAVKYARLVALLVESVKALDARVKAMEAQLAEPRATCCDGK